jgi:hypothetical protein
LLERSGWSGCEDEKRLLDKTQQRVNDLIAGYEKPAGREEKLTGMRAVVERARRELV